MSQANPGLDWSNPFRVEESGSESGSNCEGDADSDSEEEVNVKS